MNILKRTISTASVATALVLAIIGCSTEPDPTGAEQSATIVSPAIEAKPTAEPTKLPAPTEMPKAIREAGICGRTPEVQTVIIDLLHIPSCQVINAAELYRIRELAIGAESVKSGDFDDLPNLLELSVGVQEPPATGIFSDLSSLKRLTMRFGNQESPDGELLPLAPGTFEGLSSLGYLELNSSGYRQPQVQISPGVFKGLEQLQGLDIDYLESIPVGSLAELQQLKSLKVAGLESVSSGAFHNLQNLEAIELRHSTSESKLPPRLPKELFRELPLLQSVHMSEFRWPPAVELNNLKVACRIGEWYQDDGYRIGITVDGKDVEYLGGYSNDDKYTCELAINDDEIVEVILPTK